MNTFYVFLQEIRPIIDAQALNTAAKVPANTLGKHYRWQDGKPDGRKCPPAHWGNIIRALCAAFGAVEIDGWSIVASFESPEIIAIRAIGDAETIEVGDGFEYLQKEHRMVYDDIDFPLYFSK